MKHLPLVLEGRGLPHRFQVYMSLLLLINSFIHVSEFKFLRESSLTLVPVQSSVGPVPVSVGATEGTCWPESLDGTLYDRGGLPSYTDMKVEYKFVRKKKGWGVACSGRTRLCSGIILQGGSSLHWNKLPYLWINKFHIYSISLVVHIIELNMCE